MYNITREVCVVFHVCTSKCFYSGNLYYDYKIMTPLLVFQVVFALFVTVFAQAVLLQHDQGPVNVTALLYTSFFIVLSLGRDVGSAVMLLLCITIFPST
jgi:hypothetical protein